MSGSGREGNQNSRTKHTATRDGRLSQALTLRSVAGYVAHEINHPLGTIANLAALLSRRVLDPVVRPSQLLADIEAIKAETRRAADVVRNLRVLAGGIHGHSETISVRSLLYEAVTRFKRRGLEESVRVRVECPDHSLSVHGAPGLLHIVLYNMLANSAEALSDTSYPSPTVRLRAGQMPEDHVLIEVIDNGPGVPEELSDELFEPFVSTKAGGSGLGLAIARDVVEWHHGSVAHAEREHRPGACFSILLPRKMER